MPNIGFFRNYLIANNSLDFWGKPVLQNPQFDEVCFYNNTLFRKSYQDVSMQVKIYDQSSDYFTYVWYSTESDPRAEKLNNIVGTF
jgi:hypothetical protein